MVDTVLAQRVAKVAGQLLAIMDASGGFCYDTYDTRTGPLYLLLSRKRRNPLARIGLYALYAVELTAPITFRRIRGIPLTFDPMGNSYRAGAELTLFRLDGNRDRLAKAARILDEVVKRAVGPPGARGFALGFPCITGSDTLWSTSVPVAHYTVRVARKLLAWEQATGDDRYSGYLHEAARFLTTGLPWTTRDGMLGVGYTPADPLQVVNIWGDVASFLAAFGTRFHDAQTLERARALGASVIGHQHADGSWPYFARWESRPGWEDNTHTAMILGAIADLCIGGLVVRGDAIACLEKGVAHWIDTFFDERTGRHWNLIDRPGDSFTVCLGDALYAINRLLRPEAGTSDATKKRLAALEERVIAWSLDNLMMPDGRFCERRLRFKRYCVQSIRSFDGLTCDALALYLARRQLGDTTQLWTQ